MVKEWIIAASQGAQRRIPARSASLRVGAAFGNGLLYGKAGVVWGRFNFHREDSNPTNVNGSATLPGLLLGLGLEYAFSQNWTGKIEYNYLNYVETDVRFHA